MPIEIGEKEMLERFVDGLKKSSGAAKEIRVSETEKKPTVFVNFLDGIKVSAGSAHQLAHAQQNHQWLSIRDILEQVIEHSQSLVVFNNGANVFWERIENSLKVLTEKGIKIATSKAISRVDLLAGINLRELKVRDELRKEHDGQQPTS